MQIAIVDDINEERACLRLLVEQYMEIRKDRYDITPDFAEFECGETFLKSYIPGSYTLVFLDIYMEQLTGIDVAKRIAALDKNCSIIFFTTSDEYQLDGYDVHAVGYIMKPITDHIPALYTALDYVMEKQQPDQSGITILTDFGELYVYYRDILYLDFIGRKLYLHLTNKVLIIAGKYDDYRHCFLSDPRFLECYRNLIINMDYIDSPLDRDFLLKNGETLPISRRKKADVMVNFMRYFLKSGRT